MRVLFWSELFWPYVGGCEVLAEALLPALRARGFSFVVVTSQDSLDLPAEDELEGVPVYRLPFRTALRAGDVAGLVGARRRACEICRAFGPTLIHLSGVGTSALACLESVRASAAPLLVTLHQQLLPGQSNGEASVLERALRAAAWVSSVSAAALAQARRVRPEITDRSSIVYNGLQIPAAPPASFPAEPRLLCLGRLVPQKGFDIALAAFAAVRQRFPRARLTVAGDGVTRPALEQQARELGLGAAVDFLGWVPADQVPALINAATAVLLPSRWEGLPLVAIQAAFMARPVVAANVGGLAEVVAHEETGLLVPPEDSRALAEAIATLAGAPEVAIRMGRAARERAGALFAWERCVDGYAQLYRRLIESGPSRCA